MSISIRSIAIKICKENLRGKLPDNEVSNGILTMALQQNKPKIAKRGLDKMSKNLCIKEQHQENRKTTNRIKDLKISQLIKDEHLEYMKTSTGRE